MARIHRASEPSVPNSVQNEDLYDALGMRNSATGSFARTGLPQPIPSATYDGANELLAWNESAISYDSNGNMLGDGTHNYAWDARNHLSTIDSGSTGSFVYDPAGRRATKVISGSGTNFLYDLANPVQELSGTTPTANLLTGGLDQFFTRTDSNGSVDFLTDALGSSLALTDSTGTTQTQYCYEAFGNTTQSGSSTTNSFAYTGREKDGTGLYFFRTRFYNPTLGRFISQDPLGFAAGVNFYAYTLNSPTNFTDPFGLDIAVVEGGPTSGNPIGHTAVAITGDGVYSFGNSVDPGTSLAAYIYAQSSRRDQTIYIIHTTPAQDAAAASAIRQNRPIEITSKPANERPGR